VNPKSAIAKGKRFENFIAQEIEAMGLGEASREIGSGSGKRKGDIRSNLPFLIEAKNQKKLNWWESINQAKKQAEMGNKEAEKWVLIVRDPKTPEENPHCYAVVDMWEFLKLLKKDREPLVKEPDRQMKWKLQRFLQTGKDLIKEFE
jgi:hypothetical protein